MSSLTNAFFAPAITSQAIAALTMAFIPKADVGARFTAVLLIAACSFWAIAAVDRLTDEGQLCAEYTFGFILHANVFLVLLRLSAPKNGTRWSRLMWATGALFTPRRDLPKKRKRKGVPSTKVPTFIAFQTLKVLICGAFSNHLTQHFLFLDLVPMQGILPGKESLTLQILRDGLHGDALERQLLVRAEIALSGLLQPYLLLNSTHAFVSIFAVLFFNSQPGAWPPLFGSIFDAYSVGRFYSHFWSRLMRKAFTYNASFLTSRVLRIRPWTPKGRCAVVMLSFVLSGLMHTVSGWTPEGCGSWMPTWTYLATGVVVLAERGLMWGYARLMHKRKGGRGLGWPWKSWEIWGWRLLGYCWVVFWWMEILPWGAMPAMRCHGIY